MAKLRYHELTNKKFGLLTVIERVGTAKNRTPLWRCVCSCGTETIVQANHLEHNHTTSCGCAQKKRVSETASFDLIGKRFGRLIITKRLFKKLNSSRCSVWECKCDCGNITEQTSAMLLYGHTKSCGCLYKEICCVGGKSPYCNEFYFKEFKDMIKERDGYICMTPGCKNLNLCVHHIDYNKKNCNLNNLITVCRSCNCRANFNRPAWTILYCNILKIQYNYNY